MPAPIILLLAAAAQASAPSGHGRPFISPMGEPFVGGAGIDGLSQWFQRADTDRDGMLTAAEMLLDSQRFFNSLDADHDGHIDPEEIEHYENVIEPTVRFARARMIDSSGGQPAGHGRHLDPAYGAGGWEGGGGDGDDEDSGATEFGLLKIPEPVASADLDFSRDVSADEFRRTANERFQLLDTAHSGRLTLPQLEALSDAARSDARKGRHRTKPSESQEPLPIPDESGGGPGG